MDRPNRYVDSRLIRSNFRQGISIHTLLLGLIFLVLFLWSNGFSFSYFDLSERFRLLQLIGMFSIVGLSVLVILFKGWRKDYSNFYVMVLFGIIFCAVFPTFLYLVTFNGLSPVEVFRVTLLYPGLFIVIVLMSFRTRPDFVRRMARMLVITITIYVAFLLIISLSPQLAESMMQRTSERFEQTRITLRYGLAILGAFAFYYFLVKAFTTKGSIKFLYILAIGLFFLFHLTTSIGRRDVLSIIAVILYYWCFHISNIKRIYGILLVVVCIASLLFIPQFEVAKKTFQSIFFTTSEDYVAKEGTIGVRLEGMKFNFQIFRESGYLGIGILSDRLPPTDPYYYGRVIYLFNPNDHGIFAVIYRFGPLGIFFTIIVLVRVYNDLKVIRKYGNYSQYQIAMAIHLVFVGELIGLSHIFWKPDNSYSFGLLFYMIWRMRKDVQDMHAGHQATLAYS